MKDCHQATHTHTHTHTHIYIYIYIHVFFHLVIFIREHILCKVLWMGCSMRLELTRVWSLNGFHLVMGSYAYLKELHTTLHQRGDPTILWISDSKLAEKISQKES